MTATSRIFAIVVASAIAAPLAAQQAPPQLLGRITVRGTGLPVDGAAVSIEGSAALVVTDSAGRYLLRGVSPGAHTLLVQRLGFAAVRVPVVIPVSGTLTVDAQLATSALHIEQVTVIADRVGRVQGETGTASVIDREAIAAQTASSIQGVLELLPGVPLQAPGLDAAAQFSLRGIPIAGTDVNNIGAAGTLIILDGVPLSNNANLQTVGVRGELAPTASTAGGGVDLRRIPASTLERVEVIRGIPSVRWGDLTQGAIIVETRAAATAPEFAGRFDPRTTEANIVGGRAWSDDRQAVTAAFNLAETRQARTLSAASTIRGAGQLAHRLSLGDPGDAAPAATLDTRFDWWRLRFDSPEREDLEPDRNSLQDDWGIRLAERARFRARGGRFEWTASFDAQRQYTSETRSLVRSAVPFTERLEEGRNIGTFAEGRFVGAYQLRGAPRLLYTRIEYVRDAAPDMRRFSAGEFRAGAELRREWNGGVGYIFELARPPQVSNISGVNGFDRPRGFDNIPAVATSAVYGDMRITSTLGETFAEVQPGVRVDLLHDGGWWTSGARSASFEPRVTARVAPRSWLRLLGGAGVVSKIPTVAQLYPPLQYFDVVNVNRYTPEPSERLAVLTTFIRDPSNPDLGHSRNTRREVGFELDGGLRRGMLSVTYFNDAQSGAVTRRREVFSVPRDHYELVDTAQGTGRPGTIVDPPTGSDPLPIFLDRSVNGGRLNTSGFEYIISLPVIPSLRTRLEVSGAKIETRFRTDEVEYESAIRFHTFQIDSTIPRSAYFEGRSNRAERAIRTWRLVHHQPELGLIVTATIQQRLGEERERTGRLDSLSFIGYITRTGDKVPVPESDRSLPEYADLRQARVDFTTTLSRQPDDWMMSIQIAKSVGTQGRLSLYFFNVLDKLVTFGGGTARGLPSSRFGAELTMPMSVIERAWRR
jgi:hypothetical protein